VFCCLCVCLSVSRSSIEGGLGVERQTGIDGCRGVEEFVENLVRYQLWRKVMVLAV